MALADGAQALGLSTNGARSRFKSGTLKGERDNQGRIWIFVDEAEEGSKKKISNSSIEAASNSSKNSTEPTSNNSKLALEGHIRTLSDQLERAQNEQVELRKELVELRVRASATDRLEAEVEGLKALRDELRADRDQWRQMAVERQTTPEVAPPEAATPRKRGLFGFISRAA
jgi:chromosome segregation ATPase